MLTSKEKERHVQSLKLEARALSQIRVCDYVIELAGTCLDKSNQICILMEYVHGPNMHQFMENFHHRLPWKKKEALAWEIAAGVTFIHDRNILHRDLKSDNILISLSPLSDTEKLEVDISDLIKCEPNLQHIHAKIADFGICKITNETYSTKESFRGAGSPPWMAPELCMDETLVPTKQSDVYSLGWILWELAVSDGRRPYEGHTMNQIFQFKVSGYVEPLPNEIPEYYRELVIACTSYEPLDRPFAGQVMETIR
ncbi:kinase-like protein, partial [Neoconidiobolus thromboides FSU 785]